MEIIEDAKEFLSTHNSDFSSTPTDVSIGTVSERVETDALFEVSGRFREEQGDDLLPPKRTVKVTPDSELELAISYLFNEVHKNVSLKNEWRIESMHLAPTREPSDDYPMPFYTSDEADYRVFVGVSRESVPSKIREELLEMVYSLYESVDETLTLDSIQSAEWFFDDGALLELWSVSGDIRTAHPELYYDVSFERYIQNVSSARPDQEEYTVEYSSCVDAEQSLMEPIPKSMKLNVEDVFETEIEETLSTPWNHRIEGEVIQIGDGEYQDGDYMKYYLYIPVVDENIGETK